MTRVLSSTDRLLKDGLPCPSLFRLVVDEYKRLWSQGSLLESLDKTRGKSNDVHCSNFRKLEVVDVLLEDRKVLVVDSKRVMCIGLCV